MQPAAPGQVRHRPMAPHALPAAPLWGRPPGPDRSRAQEGHRQQRSRGHSRIPAAGAGQEEGARQGIAHPAGAMLPLRWLLAGLLWEGAAPTVQPPPARRTSPPSQGPYPPSRHWDRTGWGAAMGEPRWPPAEAAELLKLSTQPAVTCQAREQQGELGRWDLVARAGPEPGGFQGLKYTRRKEPELLHRPGTPTANFPFGCGHGTAPSRPRAGAGSTCLPSIWAAPAAATGGALVLGATRAEPPAPRAAGPATLPKTRLLASRWKTETWLEGRARGSAPAGIRPLGAAAQHLRKTGPEPHNADAGTYQGWGRAGSSSAPGLCCRPSLLGALQPARAALTILDMAPRDCHITTPHVASRCSDGFAAAALLASPRWESSRAACSQTQALAGNQLALHPPSPPCRREKGWRSRGKPG